MDEPFEINIDDEKIPFEKRGDYWLGKWNRGERELEVEIPAMDDIAGAAEDFLGFILRNEENLRKEADAAIAWLVHRGGWFSREDNPGWEQTGIVVVSLTKSWKNFRLTFYAHPDDVYGEWQASFVNTTLSGVERVQI